jgi:flavin-dependent dehydrogenase
MNDVLVLGVGPAGSTVANLLARAGVRVKVLEKEPFPRFHIGESLLPCDLPIFERLGFVPDRARYVFKAGAEFYDEQSGDFAIFPFDEGLPGTPTHAWQVERARFDHDLAELAAHAGADVSYGARVRDAEIGEREVSVTTDAGETHRARFLVDATGQDAFLARRRKLVQPIYGFGVVAAFRHYTDLAKDAVAQLEETGNIKILILEDGWSWLIPLSGGRLSHGVVTRKRGVGPEIVDEIYEASPILKELTRGATKTEPKLIRHFAYFNREPYGSRYACVGDASAFLDPVFSSGVSLGMLGGERLADALVPALRDGTEARPDLANGVKETMRHAYVTFGSLIKSFYHTNMVRHFFFHPEPREDLKAGLISILAGDVWRTDNPFQDALLRGRRRWEPEHELREGADAEDDGPLDHFAEMG